MALTVSDSSVAPVSPMPVGPLGPGWCSIGGPAVPDGHISFPSHPQNALRLSPHSILLPLSRRRLQQCLLSLNSTRSAHTQVTLISVSPPLYRAPKRSPVRRAASQPAHIVVFLLHFCTAQAPTDQHAYQHTIEFTCPISRDGAGSDVTERHSL